MGLLDWISGKLDRGTLETSQAALQRVTENCAASPAYERVLLHAVEDMLGSLFGVDRSSAGDQFVFEVGSRIEWMVPDELDEASNRIMSFGNKVRATLPEAADAAGIVAGWLKASAIQRRGSTAVIRQQAEKLRMRYERELWWALSDSTSADGESAPDEPRPSAVVEDVPSLDERRRALADRIDQAMRRRP